MKHLSIIAALCLASPAFANGTDVAVDATGIGQSASQAGVYQEASDPTRVAPSVAPGGANNTAPCALVNGGGFAYGAPLGIGGFRSHQELTCKIIWEMQQLEKLSGKAARLAVIAQACKDERLRDAYKEAGFCVPKSQVKAASTIEIKGMTKPAILKRCEPLKTVLKREGTAAEVAEAEAFCKATR